jgi:hypothetical protein
MTPTRPDPRPLRGLTLDTEFHGYVREEGDDASEAEFLRFWTRQFDHAGIAFTDVSSTSGTELTFRATIRQFMAISPSDAFIAGEIANEREIVDDDSVSALPPAALETILEARIGELREQYVHETPPTPPTPPTRRARRR